MLSHICHICYVDIGIPFAGVFCKCTYIHNVIYSFFYYAHVGGGDISMNYIYVHHKSMCDTQYSNLLICSWIRNLRWKLCAYYLEKLLISSPLRWQTILCLIPRTTVTSLIASTNTHCKTQPNMRQSRCYFLNGWENTSCARDDKHLPPEYALTSQSFLRWDKVYTSLCPCQYYNVECRNQMYPIYVALSIERQCQFDITSAMSQWHEQFINSRRVTCECDMIKGNESHLEDFQFWDFYTTFWQTPL